MNAADASRASADLNANVVVNEDQVERRLNKNDKFRIFKRSNGKLFASQKHG